MNTCSLHGWVLTIPLKQQIPLFLALRFCDTTASSDPSRVIITELRKDVLKEILPTLQFDSLIQDSPEKDFRKMSSKMIIDINIYPISFIRSLMQAASIIGYKHPDPKTKRKWYDVYARLTQRLHLHVETEEDIDVRLG